MARQNGAVIKTADPTPEVQPKENTRTAIKSAFVAAVKAAATFESAAADTQKVVQSERKEVRASLDGRAGALLDAFGRPDRIVFAVKAGQRPGDYDIASYLARVCPGLTAPAELRQAANAISRVLSIPKAPAVDPLQAAGHALLTAHQAGGQDLEAARAIISTLQAVAPGLFAE